MSSPWRGPGLCLAKSLSVRPLKIMVLEQQTQPELEAPALDGREIALNQHRAKLARKLILRVSDRLRPFKHSIPRSLSGA